MFFFENHKENEAGRLVPDLFLFFKKALYEVKANVCSLVLMTFNSAEPGKQLKQNIYIYIYIYIYNFRMLIQTYAQF